MDLAGKVRSNCGPTGSKSQVSLFGYHIPSHKMVNYNLRLTTNMVKECTINDPLRIATSMQNIKAFVKSNHPVNNAFCMFLNRGVYPTPTATDASVNSDLLLKEAPPLVTKHISPPHTGVLNSSDCQDRPELSHPVTTFKNIKSVPVAPQPNKSSSCLVTEPIGLYTKQPVVCGKQVLLEKSYADVAKMAPGQFVQNLRSRERMPSDPSRHYQKKHYLGHNRNKSNQRPVDNENWRYRSCMKDVRRDKFVPTSAECGTAGTAISRNVDIGRQRYQKRSNGKAGHRARRIVHEKHPNFEKRGEMEYRDACNGVSAPSRIGCDGVIVPSCQFAAENSKCKNWRCRQHCGTPSPPKQNLVYPPQVKQNYVSCLSTALPQYLKRLTDVPLEKCGDALNGLRRRSCIESKGIPAPVVRDRESCSSSESENMCRRRPSECSVDSEDSFLVIFNNGDDSDDDVETDSEFSDWSGDSDDEICVSPRINDVNARWRKESESSFQERSTPKKVQFAEAASLATVHPMVQWDFAYRAARCGPWEELARDRERFRLRILRCEPILTAVLTPVHREKARLRNLLSSNV